MSILIPVLILTGLGIIFGVGLALASKKFCVESDPRIEKIFQHLPGANCGACGMPGCMGFAEGLIQGKCSVEKCAVAQDKSRHEIAKILGIDVKTKVKNIAVLHCHGNNHIVKDKFFYTGIEDCTAASMVMAGPKECFYGCIGFGNCKRACPFGAITIGEDGLPIVNEDKCTACGKCVSACPKKLFSLVPINKIYTVRCKSLDFGKKVLDVCSVGCIGCRKCEKACPIQAIQVVDNLSIIDYNICDNKGDCFKACPTRAIARKEGKLWLNQK